MAAQKVGKELLARFARGSQWIKSSPAVDQKLRCLGSDRQMPLVGRELQANGQEDAKHWTPFKQPFNVLGLATTIPQQSQSQIVILVRLLQIYFETFQALQN